MSKWLETQSRTFHLKVFKDVVFLQAEVISLGLCLGHKRTLGTKQEAERVPS
jgi:hypothetical protein